MKKMIIFTFIIGFSGVASATNQPKPFKKAIYSLYGASTFCLMKSAINTVRGFSNYFIDKNIYNSKKEYLVKFGNCHWDDEIIEKHIKDTLIKKRTFSPNQLKIKGGLYALLSSWFFKTAQDLKKS